MNNWKGYDSSLYVSYSDHKLWIDRWDWERIRKLKKTPHERALLDLRIAVYNLGNKFTTVREQDRAIRRAHKKLLPYELREIDRIQKELEKKELFEPFDTNKKSDRWSVIYERRDKDDKRTYIYKTKRINGKLIKIYLGKNWLDIVKKIGHRAKTQVLGEKYALFGLSRWQMKIYIILAQALMDLPQKKYAKYRNPILQKYIEQLEMTCVNAGTYTKLDKTLKFKERNDRFVILSKNMRLEDKKRILDNARKAIQKHDRDVDNKEDRIMAEFESIEEEITKKAEESKRFKTYEEYYEYERPKVIYINKTRLLVHYYD